jgi:MFS family permease
VPTHDRPRLFYGWIILGGAFLSFTTAAGLMHSYTVFFVAFLGEFGWSRAETSVAYAVAQFVSGVSAPFVGMLSDRLGPRVIVLVGGSILAGGLAASAGVSSLGHLIVLYGVVMTIGANCLGLVVFVPLLSRWFVRKRGLVIAIVQSANGLGRAYSAPLAQLLIASLGWRRAYLALAIGLGVLIVPLTWFFRARDPAEMGLGPDGMPALQRQAAAPVKDAMERPARPASLPPSPRNWRLEEAICTPQFWLLMAVYLCTGLGSFLVSLHQLAFAVDVGFDPLYAASVLGIGSFLAIGGIIGTGTLSDYIGREGAAILAYGVSILGVCCALAISNPSQTWLLWLHACFFGLTWGARGPAITAKTVDLFPGTHVGTILGVITIGSGIGSAAGSWTSGWIFDRTGSYRVAFWLSIASYLVGCVAFWLLRRPAAR